MATLNFFRLKPSLSDASDMLLAAIQASHLNPTTLQRALL